MLIAQKVTALLDGMSGEELKQMHPADRRRFAELCWHWFQLADRGDQEPKAGILADLRNGGGER